MLTDTKSGSMRIALHQIYVSIYVEYVVKNPLSPVEHPGGLGVNNELFEITLEQFVVRFTRSIHPCGARFAILTAHTVGSSVERSLLAHFLYTLKNLLPRPRPRCRSEAVRLRRSEWMIAPLRQSLPPRMTWHRQSDRYVKVPLIYACMACIGWPFTTRSTSYSCHTSIAEERIGISKSVSAKAALLPQTAAVGRRDKCDIWP
jgi:Sybindin-like family